MAQLEIHDLSFTYPGQARPTIENISLSVEQGQFVAVCGATGSGKTTLLRCLKRQLTPMGELTGEITWDGAPLSAMDDRTAASTIGYVMQRPEEQIATDKVWHELAFGLENLGAEPRSIRRRVAEMACYFGIESWFEQSTDRLSGGQKQLLNLASVMVMDPEIIILDEPTAQLDPIAAADFLATLKRLNRELGLTVIIAEHRLEDVIPDCDRLLILDKGRVLDFDRPEKAAARLGESHPLTAAMPAAVRLYTALARPEDGEKCPLSVRDGRRYVSNNFDNAIRSLPAREYTHSPEPAVEFDDCWFSYGRELPDVLRGLELTVYRGEAFFILGGNGSGKTTALSAAAGLLRCYSGKIRILGKKLSEYKNNSLYRECLAMLGQDVQTLFLHSTVREELDGVDVGGLLPYDFTPLMDMHPYDLSGGQQQLLGMAKALAARPKVLLLDEPTKGLDPSSKAMTADTIRRLTDRGVTVITVTHDVEFAACCADRCALFFRGEIASIGMPGEFFSGSSFYTTAVSRMTRGRYDSVVTVEDAVEICRKNRRK